MKLHDFLPEQIVLKDGTILKRARRDYPFLNSAIIAECKKQKAKYRTVRVLAKKLRGKTNLHGYPYVPHVWIYTNATIL